MAKKTTRKVKKPRRSERDTAKSRVKKSKSKLPKTKWENPNDPVLYFYSADGSTIKSLEELPEALTRMEESIYLRHVEEDVNDFSNWVRDVFNMSELARDLEKAADRNSSIGTVKRALEAEEDTPA